MLQNIRNKSGNLIIKVILVLIGLSFLSWGVNDIVRMLNSPPPIVKIDKKKISVEEFEYKLKKLISNLRQNGINKDFNEILNYEFYINFLNSLIEEELIKTEPKKMGFSLNNDFLINLIKSEKNFQNGGNFDENIFREYISRSGKSLDAFFSEVESDLLMKIITNGIILNANLPNEYLSILWKTFSRKKNFEIAYLDPNEVEFNKKISEKTLKSWVEKNKNLYTRDEERNAKILIVDHKIIGRNFPVSEEEINSSYDAYKREQIAKIEKYFDIFVIKNFDDSKKISAELNIGKNSKEIRHSFPLVKVDFDVPLIKKQISKELFEKIWNLNKNEAAEPILVGENYLVIQLKKSGKIEIKELAEIRENILNEIKLRKSQGKLAEVKDQIEDMIAANKKIEEISKIFNFEIFMVSELTKKNYVEKLNKFETKIQSDMSNLIFEMDVNSPGEIIDTSENFSYVIQTTSITEDHLDDFEKIKEKVIVDYTNAKKEEILMKKMKKIAKSSKTVSDWKKNISNNNLKIIIENPSILDLEKKSEKIDMISKFNNYKLMEILLIKVGENIVEKTNDGKIAIMRCVGVTDVTDSVLYQDSYNEGKKVKEIFEKNHINEIQKMLPSVFCDQHKIEINHEIINKKILKNSTKNEED